MGPTVCSNVLGWCDGVLSAGRVHVPAVPRRRAPATLHPLLELVQLLVIKHRAAQTTTGSLKKAHVLDLPVDHVETLYGFAPTVICIEPEDAAELLVGLEDDMKLVWRRPSCVRACGSLASAHAQILG